MKYYCKKDAVVANALVATKIRHINKKFEDCNVVNDEELNILIAQYQAGIDALAPLGPVFKLARTELIRRLDICNAWKTSRKEQDENYAKYQGRGQDNGI